jgi:hypothetical protein
VASDSASDGRCAAAVAAAWLLDDGWGEQAPSAATPAIAMIADFIIESLPLSLIL